MGLKMFAAVGSAAFGLFFAGNASAEDCSNPVVLQHGISGSPKILSSIEFQMFFVKSLHNKFTN